MFSVYVTDTTPMRPSGASVGADDVDDDRHLADLRERAVDARLQRGVLQRAPPRAT